MPMTVIVACCLLLLFSVAPSSDSFSMPLSNQGAAENFHVRPLQPNHGSDDDDDSNVLWKFLSIAASHHTDIIVLEDIKSNPVLSRYVDGIFEEDEDERGGGGGAVGVLAETLESGETTTTASNAVGAAWVRFWKDPLKRGFGFVQADIPELAIGVLADNQGQGIGTALMTHLLREAKSRDIPGISLSVRGDNTAAVKLYERFGFEPVPGSENGSSFNMVKLLDEEAVLLRSATPDDITTILTMLHKKADFDATMSSTITRFTATEEKLRLYLFDPDTPPRAHVLLAEQKKEIIGMAVYYYRFSSFAAQPSLWLEDLIVSEDYRSQGVGHKIMNHLQGIAHAAGCTHLGWTASAQNARALMFYVWLGAQVMDQHGDQCTLKWMTTSETPS